MDTNTTFHWDQAPGHITYEVIGGNLVVTIHFDNLSLLGLHFWGDLYYADIVGDQFTSRHISSEFDSGSTMVNSGSLVFDIRGIILSDWAVWIGDINGNSLFALSSLQTIRENNRGTELIFTKTPIEEEDYEEEENDQNFE